MIYPIDINEYKAKELQSYVIDGIIDLKKYDFTLECSQKPSYKWENENPLGYVPAPRFLEGFPDEVRVKYNDAERDNK